MPSISLISGLITLPAKLALVVLQYYTVGTKFTNKNTQKSLKTVLHVAILQHTGQRLTILDIQLAWLPVAGILKKLEPNLGHLPNYNRIYTDKHLHKANSIWLTDNRVDEDSPVLLYFHGGCFALQMIPDQIQGMANLYEAYELRYGKKLSILLLDYSLTLFDHTFPTQLNEMYAVYDKVVADGYRNIGIIGDSAGGNMVLNTLLYLQRESSSRTVVWPNAAISISPYLNVTHLEWTGSFKKNTTFDWFTYPMCLYLGYRYTGGDKLLDLDPRVNLELNWDKIDWQSIPTIRDGRLLTSVGTKEILADEIFRWVDKTGIKERYPETVLVEEDGLHAGIFVSESYDFGSIEDFLKSFNADAYLNFLHDKYA